MKPQRTYILLFPFFYLRIMPTKVVIAAHYEFLIQLLTEGSFPGSSPPLQSCKVIR